MHAPARIPLALALTALLVAPVLTAAAPAAVASGDPWYEETGVTGLATATLLDATTTRIHEIKAPLLAVPAIAPPAGSFDVELAIPADAVVGGMTLTTGERATRFSPAFGSAGCALAFTEAGTGPTRLWGDDPDLVVRHFEARVSATCPPGAYDLVVGFEEDGWARMDHQPNAVHVMDPARWDALASGDAEPRFVVLADPQVGDPRAGQDGVEDALREQDPRPFAEGADGVLGDGSDGENGRWKAFRAAVRAARAENPDFILIAGDLAFGQAVPGSYAVEYEEMYDLLLAIGVPFYTTIGNHDGYVSNGQDGYAYWRAYVGPLHYATTLVPGTHLVSVNAYDWSELDRMGASIAVSAWGGQVRAEQMAWVADALADVRATHGDERVIALMHQSPSWRQDPYRDADPTGVTAAADGVPVLEQATRGAVAYGTTDQGWTGEGRLELRDLLRAFDVEMVFAGHTHRDRIARDDGAGRIVETHQSSWGRGDDYDPRALHYTDRDDTLLHGYTQEALADLVRTAPGPLYVDTTTALSGTSQYWGYRVVDLAYDEDGHLVLENFGVGMTEEDLTALARNPALFNPAHAELGLFSKPLHLEVGEPWRALAGDV